MELFSWNSRLKIELDALPNSDGRPEIGLVVTLTGRPPGPTSGQENFKMTTSNLCFLLMRGRGLQG